MAFEPAGRRLVTDAFKTFIWRCLLQFWADVSPDIDKVYYLMAVVVEQQFRYTDLVDRLIHYNMDEVSNDLRVHSLIFGHWFTAVS